LHDNFEYFLNQAFAPFAILTGKELVFTFANAAYVELMNGRELVGKPLREAIPEIQDQPFIALLQNVIKTGIPFHTSQIEATAMFAGNTKATTKYFNLSYTPYKNKEGITEGILASGYDVTEEVMLRNKEKTQVLNMQAYDLFMHAPVGFCLTKGDSHVMELANKAFLTLTGREETVIGKPIIDIFPEADVQGYLTLFNNVLKNKKALFLNETAAVFLKSGVRELFYLNIVLQPYFEDNEAIGILSILTDVTDHVVSRKKVEESEERLRLAIETTNMGTWEYLPLTGRLTWSDECKKIYHFPLDKEVDYALFSDHIYPEDKETAQGAIQQAMDANGPGIYDIEYRILRYDDKSVRWIRAQGKVYFNNEKDPVKFIGTVLDITESKNREESLRVNEERLRLAIESAKLGTYELDLINNTIIYSDRLGELFGLDPSKKLTHHDLKNALHPDDLKIRDEAHATANKTGNLFYHARVVWPDSSVHWLRFNGKVLFNGNGEALKNYGTVMDITREKEREDILKESQQKFELIAETIPHMVWEIEIDGKISYINKQWQNWSGLTLEEINNNGWSKITHPDDVESVAKGWQQAFETKNEYIGECRFKNPEGGYSWFTLKTVPVRNDAGEIEVWLGTATNTNEKKLIEQQKDAFISIASHELKTPLTTLKAYGQIVEGMLERKSDIETLQMVRRMSTQVNKLTTLIQDLLDISRIQHGKLIYNESFFDFNEAVREVINDMQKTTVTHEIVNDLDTSVKVYGDKEKLSQVINNFISNAIKYSPKATSIVVKTSVQNNGVQLSVQDFGIGISSTEQEHVFEQFYRVTGDSQSTFPGMGIGLYICSEIIKSMGGKIWVESRINEGSAFYISLPLDYRNIS
jgi:PAS domain S-box-containing protein